MDYHARFARNDKSSCAFKAHNNNKNQNLLATQSFGRKHCINKPANFVPKFVVHLRMNSKTTKLYQKIQQNLSKKKKTKITRGS